jgi:hypothetical protein
MQANVLDVAGQRKQADEALELAARTWPEVEFIERLRFGSAIASGNVDVATAMANDPVVGPLINSSPENQRVATLLRALATGAPQDIAALEQSCSNPSMLARERAAWCLQGLVALGRLEEFFRVVPAYFPEQRGATDAERDARWLEAPRVWRYARVLFRSDMKAVRADPRFIPIVERLGLVDYWRSSGKWPDFCKTEPDSVCALMRDGN